MTDEHFEKAWGTTLMTGQEQEIVNNTQKKVKGQNGQTGTAPPGPTTDTNTATTPPAIPQIDGMDIVNAAKDLNMKANTKGYETGLNKDDIDAAYAGLAGQIGERYQKEREDVGDAPKKDEAKMREEREAANRAEGNYYKEQKWDKTADMERIGEKETLEVPNYREHVTDDQMQGWGRALANFGSVGLKEGANAIDAATKALGEFRKLTRAFLSPNPMSAASQMLASTMVGMNTMYDTIDRAGEIAGIKQGADRSIVMETAKGAQYYKDKDRATQAANFMMQAFNDQIADTLGPDGDVTQLNPAQFKRIYEKMEEAWAPEIERIRKEHEAGVPPSLEDRAIMAGWDNISKQYVKNMREGKATAREYSKEIGEHEKNIRALDQDYNRRVKEYNKVIADIDKRALGEQRALDKEYRSDMKNIGKESKAMETWQRGYDDAVANNDAIGALLRVTLGPGAQRHLKDGNAVEHTLLTAQNRANANAHKDNANFTDEQKAVWSRIAEYLGQRVQEVRNMSAEQRRQYARSLAGQRAIEGAKGTGRRGGQTDDDPLGFFDKTKKQRKAIRKMTAETYADKMMKEWWEGHALSEDQALDPRSSKLYKGAENIIRQMARIERSVYKKGNKLTPEKRVRALALMEKHQDDLDTIEDLLWGYQQIDTSAIFPKSYLDQYQGMNRDEYLTTLDSKEREFPRITGRSTDVSSYNAANDEYEGAKKELETLRYDFLHGMYDDSWQYRRDAKLKGERLQRKIDRLRNTLTAQKEEFDRKQAERDAKREEEDRENQDRLAGATADNLRATLLNEDAFHKYVRDNLYTKQNISSPFFGNLGMKRLIELAEDMTPEERKTIADYITRGGYKNIDALVDKLMEGYQPEDDSSDAQSEEGTGAPTGREKEPKKNGNPRYQPKGDDYTHVLSLIKSTDDIDTLQGMIEKIDKHPHKNNYLRQLKNQAEKRISELSQRSDVPPHEEEGENGETEEPNPNPFYSRDATPKELARLSRELEKMDDAQVGQLLQWIDDKASHIDGAEKLKADAEARLERLRNPQPEQNGEVVSLLDEAQNLLKEKEGEGSRVDEDVIDETENTETETTGTENTIDDRNPISEEWKTKLNEAINNGDEFTLDQLISELDGRISVVNNKNKESKGKGKTITDLGKLLADAKEKREELRKRVPERFEERSEENLDAAYTKGPNVPGEGQTVEADNELDPANFKEPGDDSRKTDSAELKKELPKTDSVGTQEHVDKVIGGKNSSILGMNPKTFSVNEAGKIKWTGATANALKPKLSALENDIDSLWKNIKKVSRIDGAKSLREEAIKLYEEYEPQLKYIEDHFKTPGEKAKTKQRLDSLMGSFKKLRGFAYADNPEKLGDVDAYFTTPELEHKKQSTKGPQPSGDETGDTQNNGAGKPKGKGAEQKPKNEPAKKDVKRPKEIDSIVNYLNTLKDVKNGNNQEKDAERNNRVSSLNEELKIWKKDLKNSEMFKTELQKIADEIKQTLPNHLKVSINPDARTNPIISIVNKKQENHNYNEEKKVLEDIRKDIDFIKNSPNISDEDFEKRISLIEQNVLQAKELDGKLHGYDISDDFKKKYEEMLKELDTDNRHIKIDWDNLKQYNHLSVKKPKSEDSVTESEVKDTRRRGGRDYRNEMKNIVSSGGEPDPSLKQWMKRNDALVLAAFDKNVDKMLKRFPFLDPNYKSSATSPFRESATPSFRDMLTKRFDETHKDGHFIW